jgi:hypothetical protein
MNFIFRRVVSVCCVIDYKVWKLTSYYLPKYIDSIEYLLIVPDNEVSFFVSITPSVWTVRGEGEFCYDYSKSNIDTRMEAANIGRAGWYLQQFLKINAIVDPVLNDDDYVLIWDADTVPLKKLKFIDDANSNGNQPSLKLMFYSGIEFHRPYFVTSKIVFGIERVGDFSFIAQCLPTKVAWVREMLSPLSDYVNSVLSVLPGESFSEFSEYETIGSFCFSRHKSNVALNHRRWCRLCGGLFGISKFKFANKLMLFIYSLFYDYVAFEKWQKPIWKKWLR